MFLSNSGKGFLMVAAAAAWAVAGQGRAAMAQQAGNMQQQPSPSQQQQVPSQQGAPGTGMPDSTQNQPGQNGYADQMFVHDTLEGDDAQVAMSQLAVQKSSSDDVKQFSAKMVQIHTDLSNQMRPAAKALGMSEPKGPSKKEQKEIDHLQALNGPDFDTEYIEAMARQQRHDLKEFKDEAQSGQTPNIQQAAKLDEPVLAEHLQILEKLAAAHNVTLESSK